MAEFDADWRRRGPWLAVAALLLLCAVASEGLWRWLAVAAIGAVAGPELLLMARPGGAAGRIQGWLRRFGPQLVVLAVAAWLLHPLWLGQPPASRDHSIHYFQTAVFVDEILPQGALWGWSQRLNHGVPFGESYPVLGYLWVAAAHLLSAKLIPLRVSYAWGIAAVWLLGTWGAWHLGRRIGVEVDRGENDETRGLARWCAGLAAVLWLLDTGGSRQGGWQYAMFHGVWPQLLSTGLWLGSLEFAMRARETPSGRWIAATGLAIAGSVLAHPFGLLTATCSGVLWPAVLWATGRHRAGTTRVWLIIHAVAIAIVAGWLSVFFAAADSMARSPAPWAPLGSLATDLAKGDLFASHFVWIGGLALVGIALAIRRGRGAAWLAVGLVAGMLVLGSTAAITVLRLDLIASGFKNLQFPRYAFAIKPPLFALAATGLVIGFDALRRWWKPTGKEQGAPTNRRRRFVLALLLAPLAVALVEDVGRLTSRPLGSVDTLETHGHDVADAKLRRALLAEKKRLGEQPLVVAFLRQGMGAGTYPMFAVADVGGALVVDGHIPSVNFRHRINRRSIDALVAMGVTHVLHERRLRKRDAALAKRLEDMGKFGPFRLQRLVDSEPARFAHSPMRGAELAVSGTPTAITVRVAGVSGPNRVDFVLPPYHRWRARYEGEPVPLQQRALVAGLTTTAVELPGPGTVELTYHVSPRQRWATWVSIGGLLVAGFGLTRAKPLRFGAVPRPPRALLWAVIVAIIAAGWISVRRRQATLLRASWTEAVDAIIGTAYVFSADLVIDDRLETQRYPDRVCDPLLTRNALDGCSETDHRARDSMLYRAPFVYRCTEITLAAHGKARFTLDLRPGQAAIGVVHRVKAKRATKKMYWSLDGAKEKQLVASAEFPISAAHVAKRQAAGEAIFIDIRNGGARLERVCVAAATVIRAGE